MNFKQILMIWAIVPIVIFANPNADQLLLKVASRLNGMDRTLIVESNIIKKGKIKTKSSRRTWKNQRWS